MARSRKDAADPPREPPRKKRSHGAIQCPICGRQHDGSDTDQGAKSAVCEKCIGDRKRTARARA